MKKIIYVIFTLVLVLNIAMIVNAEDLDKTAVALEGKTAAEYEKQHDA